MRQTSPRDSTRSGPVPDPVDGPERIPWSLLGPDFIAKWGRPRGTAMPEHLEILGQSGSGKSYFELCVLLQRQRARRSHIVVLATKPADETVSATGWPIINRWPPPDGRETAHVFWPPAGGLSVEATKRQAAAHHKLLSQLWRPGANIIVVFDEIADFCTDLNFPGDDIPMRNTITRYYREARALGITIVASTQRPQGVIRQVHSESSWTVCFAPKDEEDAERMAQVLGGKRTYMPILNTLDRENYEFLIVHGLTGQMYVSWIDHPLPASVKGKRG